MIVTVAGRERKRSGRGGWKEMESGVGVGMRTSVTSQCRGVEVCGLRNARVGIGRNAFGEEVVNRTLASFVVVESAIVFRMSLICRLVQR
jgi:hypothetical protein